MFNLYLVKLSSIDNEKSNYQIYKCPSSITEEQDIIEYIEEYDCISVEEVITKLSVHSFN